MTSGSPPAEVLAEIDATHLAVRDAFRHRDLVAYTAYLAPTLAFQGVDGRVLSRDRLTGDVQRQFDRMVAFDSTFDRRTAHLEGGALTETGTQTAWIALRLFAIFALRWRVERTGRYVWARGGRGWQLQEVRIEREEVTRAGFGLASRMDSAAAGDGSPAPATPPIATRRR